MDIAWFIYTDRLTAAGYPFKRTHPRIFKWHEQLKQREEFSKEVRTLAPQKLVTKLLQMTQTLAGRNLEEVAGF